MAYMGIAVRNDVLLTAETMCVIYKKAHALGVLPDGWAQIVTQV